MKCQTCQSKRIAHVSAKCKDMCYIEIPKERNHDGYVPYDMGIGYAGYIEINYCLDCGQIQGEFPLPITELEK